MKRIWSPTGYCSFDPTLLLPPNGDRESIEGLKITSKVSRRKGREREKGKHKIRETVCSGKERQNEGKNEQRR